MGPYSSTKGALKGGYILNERADTRVRQRYCAATWLSAQQLPQRDVDVPILEPAAQGAGARRLVCNDTA